MIFPVFRFVSAWLVGYILSFTGTLSQWSTESDLASPSTLGVDAFSVFIILISQIFLWSLGNIYSLPLISSVIGLIAAVFLYYFPWNKIFHQELRFDFKRSLLLMGLSLNLCIGALFALMHFLSMSFGLEFPSSLWFGQMHSPITFQFLIIAVYVFLIGILLKRLGSKIYLFHIGTGLTKTLGFDLVPLYRDVILIIFLGTHLVVSQFGVFSFMGLILPPLLRNLSKSKNFQFEITWGACLSGLIFAVLDLGCYFITFDGAEFPVGLFSSLIGSFVLLILSWKRFLSI